MGFVFYFRANQLLAAARRACAVYAEVGNQTETGYFENKPTHSYFSLPNKLQIVKNIVIGH